LENHKFIKKRLDLGPEVSYKKNECILKHTTHTCMGMGGGVPFP